MAAAVIRKRTQERAGDRRRRAKVDSFKVSMAWSWEENKWEETLLPPCLKFGGEETRKPIHSVQTALIFIPAHACVPACSTEKLWMEKCKALAVIFFFFLLTGSAQLEGTAQTDWPGSELKRLWRSEHFVYFWKWILIRLLQVDLQRLLFSLALRHIQEWGGGGGGSGRVEPLGQRSSGAALKKKQNLLGIAGSTRCPILPADCLIEDVEV